MMLNAILSLTAALMMVVGNPPSKSHKSMPADVGPGNVAWFDITTTNLQQSKEFYGKLFDWQFIPVQGTDQAYVQVTDIQAGCKKAQELGGTVVPGFPFNLPDGIGAIGLVVDPAGHPVGLYSRTPLAPTPSPAK
jgi:predicted enzyme related to lactoylglutathione lyase